MKNKRRKYNNNNNNINYNNKINVRIYQLKPLKQQI